MAEISEVAQMREELAQAREEIANLKVRTVTTLSGADLVTVLMLLPLVLCFVVLGTLIVYKTTTNPTQVAPHLDLILVSLAIFSNPVSAAMGAIMGRYSDQAGKGRKPDASD
jgi:hypothetical protein